jgi:hypothetical protein
MKARQLLQAVPASSHLPRQIRNTKALIGRRCPAAFTRVKDDSVFRMERAGRKSRGGISPNRGRWLGRFYPALLALPLCLRVSARIQRGHGRMTPAQHHVGSSALPMPQHSPILSAIMMCLKFAASPTRLKKLICFLT